MINLIKEYFEKRIELIKLDATEKTLKVIGAAVPFIIVIVLLVFFLFLLNVGIGFLIGNALENYGYGFLILAAFYLLVILLAYLFRNNIKTLIVNKAIKNIYNS